MRQCTAKHGPGHSCTVAVDQAFSSCVDALACNFKKPCQSCSFVAPALARCEGEVVPLPSFALPQLRGLCPSEAKTAGLDGWMPAADRSPAAACTKGLDTMPPRCSDPIEFCAFDTAVGRRPEYIMTVRRHLLTWMTSTQLL